MLPTSDRIQPRDAAQLRRAGVRIVCVSLFEKFCSVRNLIDAFRATE